MQKIILYYKFVPVADPDMTMRWQRELCGRLDLRGRIIIAAQGINGTLGGETEDLKAYVQAMNRTPSFKNIEYKWSDGSREDFPRLSVKVRNELVTLEPGTEIDVSKRGTPLRPKAWRRFIQDHPDVTIIDARNRYESEIGAFKRAIKPNIETFKQIKDFIKKLPKDKPLLTYCTGDIRCEYLSAYMTQNGFSEVYHLDGGIVKYGEQFGDDGLWEGKCYVFDKRMNIAFSPNTEDIGACSRCGQKTSNHENCQNPKCNRLLLVCPKCYMNQQTCSTVCGSAAGLLA